MDKMLIKKTKLHISQKKTKICMKLNLGTIAATPNE